MLYKHDFYFHVWAYHYHNWKELGALIGEREGGELWMTTGRGEDREE